VNERGDLAPFDERPRRVGRGELYGRRKNRRRALRVVALAAGCFRLSAFVGSVLELVVRLLSHAVYC
jgi:hypothetical protein